jgi:8-oxo-dGDP phosphatase
MASYEVESSRVAHEGILTRVRVDDVRMPDGNLKQREVVEQTPAVAVIALDEEGRVTLVRQYRHPLRDRLLEAPAGKLDVDGEEPEAAARRELAEEAGLAASRWELLVRFHNSGGWTDEHTLVYLATGVRQTEPPDGFAPEAEEAEIEIVRLPLTDAVSRIASGEITDAKTVIGLLLTQRRVDAAVGG